MAPLVFLTTIVNVMDSFPCGVVVLAFLDMLKFGKRTLMAGELAVVDKFWLETLTYVRLPVLVMDLFPVLEPLFLTTTSNNKLIVSLAPNGLELVILPRTNVKAGLIVVSLIL
jgi:hypothetical protein